MFILTKILQPMRKETHQKNTQLWYTPTPAKDYILFPVHHYNIKNMGVKTYLGALGAGSSILVKEALEWGPLLSIFNSIAFKKLTSTVALEVDNALNDGWI